MTKYDESQTMTRGEFMRELAEIGRQDVQTNPRVKVPEWFPIVPPLVYGAPHHWYTLDQMMRFGIACAEAQARTVSTQTAERYERALDDLFRRPSGFNVSFRRKLDQHGLRLSDVPPKESSGYPNGLPHQVPPPAPGEGDGWEYGLYIVWKTE